MAISGLLAVISQPYPTAGAAAPEARSRDLLDSCPTLYPLHHELIVLLVSIGNINNDVDEATYARPSFGEIPSRSESEASCCKNCTVEADQLHFDAYQSHLRGILNELRSITRKMRADEAEDAVRKEWKFTARVIDRFCLVIFSIVNLISTVSIFFSAPQIIESFRA
ncbi:unnamed protein product [Schistocephalus solidus]|uniref:Neur_chan_memb domain-containing protein n=1 Tax=Schistocephalus solidus TaxID=70667 RepID=A0A183TSQ7_SCHSO|nr:unnamed protein product [Schistocephalus solidus]